MKIRRRCTVFGSRFLFFALAPWLLVCVPLFPYMAYNFSDGIGTTLLAASESALCVLGSLVTIDSWSFIRLTIGFLWLVPIVYAWYFCQTLFADGMSFTPSLRISRVSPFSGFLGFLVWGIPSIFGARRLMRKARRIRGVEEKLRLRHVVRKK